MMYLSVIFIFLSLGCAPKGPHRPIEKPTLTLTKGAVGYNQVRPIFAQYCSACHPSRSGPDWLNYASAKPYVLNGVLIRRVATERSMPPPFSSQAAAIRDEDRNLLVAWANTGGLETGSAPDGPASAPAPAATAAEPFQHCIQCHGQQGPSTQAQAKIPRINGQNDLYLKTELQDFKWRRRVDPTETMNEIAAELSDEDIEAAASHFASQKGLPVDLPPTEMTLNQQLLVELGRDLAAKTNLNCLSCHMDPEPADPSIPKLAGQSEQYLRNQLIYFRSLERKNPLMNEFAKDLSDQDISALSIYFSRGRK